MLWKPLIGLPTVTNLTKTDILLVIAASKNVMQKNCYRFYITNKPPKRTKELLFSGSKRSFDVPRDANCNEIYSTAEMNSEYVNMEEDMPIRNERQMVISSTGQLANPDGGSTNAFQALMRARKANVSSNCQCCKGQAASQDRCGFCEKSICYDCVRSCTACDGHFCQLCSVMSPDDPLHQWFCQKCSYRLNPYIYWTAAF